MQNLILDQSVQQWVVIAIMLAVIVGLYFERWKPPVVFLAGVFLLLVLKIIQPKDFLSTFSNEQIISIFLLIFITSAINDNFRLTFWFEKLFSKTENPQKFLGLLTLSVAGLSSFMNNTPIVNLMIPYVRKWGITMEVSPSKLLIPLAYSASLGGMITVIGTSTNLILNGFLEQSGVGGLGVSEFMPLGLLVTIIGCAYLSFVGYKILPDRLAPVQGFRQGQRQYLVETVVENNSLYIGQSIADAGLRNLQEVYVAQIVRGEKNIAPVGPDLIIESGDRLFFVGDTHQVVAFIKTVKGLELISERKNFRLGKNLNVVEAIVPANSGLAGNTVKEYGFREAFDAAIIGIHRNGERVLGKIGNLRLQNGDLLLMLVGKQFYTNRNKDKNLYVVSNVNHIEEDNPFHKRSFLIILGLVFILLFFDIFSLFLSLLVLIMALIVLKLLPMEQVRKGTNFSMFVVLASALTLGETMISTGTAEMIAEGFFGLFVPYGRTITLIGIFIFTLLLTSFITNVAAVSIAFPIVFALVSDLGADGTPYYLTVAFAASASFLTPISYQTNLMVYGPGSYTYKDYLKVGAPLTLLYGFTVITYLVWMY